ncbi:MAG: DUF169 domain-containing protein [Spirochaetales bacterium]|nr:DUF169 domain-containing protein [Spirochaetales bacterium]
MSGGKQAGIKTKRWRYMDGKMLKDYEEFMQALGSDEPPLTARYSDTLPPDYASPKGGFYIEIKSAKDMLYYAGNLKLLDEKRKEFKCVFHYISETRKKGIPSVFDFDHFGCPGARFYLGFIPSLPKFNSHFTTTGFPLLYRGERLAASPASAERHAQLLEGIKPKGRYLLFERFDKLPPEATPEVITFFSNPEIISGLTALARYVTDDMDAVRAPFTSGCASIFTVPFSNGEQGIRKAVLGIFDPASRPFLNPGEMTLSLHFPLFLEMLKCYKKSFMGDTGRKRYLIKNVVPGWPVVRSRAKKLVCPDKKSD